MDQENTKLSEKRFRLGLPIMIKSIRKEQGIDQGKFAKKLGTSRATISAWEKGRRYPKLATIFELAHMSGLNVDSFIKKAMSLTPETYASNASDRLAVTVATNLTLRMAITHKNARKVSEETGLSMNTIYQMKLGHTKQIRFETLGKLSKALSCKPEDFFKEPLSNE